MSKREDSATLYLYVKQYILKLLISGKYPSDSQLPTEHQLMKDLNVGRATVRAALAQLEEEGTIYKRQGVGTFVGKKDSKFRFEPFTSLSFMINVVGLELKNKIIEQDDFTTSGDTEFVEKGLAYKRIKRVRFEDGAPVIFDHNLVLPEDYVSLSQNHIADSASLNHYIFNKYGKDVNNIKASTITREPTMEECKLLKIGVDEEIAEVTRGIYIKGSKNPVLIQRIIVPSHILELPLFLS